MAVLSACRNGPFFPADAKHSWGVKLSCAVSSAANAWSKTSCSAVSLLSAICNLRGSSCCFVPRRVQTICFGCCRAEPSQRLAHLPVRFGGLGLRSAVDAAPSAYWASWADCLPAIRARAPLAADRLAQALQSATETAAPLAAARHAAAYLREQGYDAPPWASLQQGQPPPGQSDRDFGDFLRGWQHGALMRLPLLAISAR